MKKETGSSPLFAPLVCVLAMGTLNPASALGDGKVDFYQRFAHQSYFDLPTTARHYGMASASVASTSDNASILSNPAGLGFMQDAEVSGTYAQEYITGKDQVTYRDVEQDLDHGHFLAAFPIGPQLDAAPNFGNVGFGWSGFSSESDDSFNLETEGYRVHVAYAIPIGDTLSAGYSFAYLNHEQESSFAEFEVDDGYRHAIGVQFRPSDSLTIGSSAFVGWSDPKVDLIDGPDVGLDQESWGVDIGVSQQIGATMLSLRVDWIDYEIDDDSGAGFSQDGDAFGVRAGVEQALSEWMQARLGYRYQGNLEYDFDNDDSLSDTAKFNAVSAGLGVQLEAVGYAVRLDYAAEYRWVGDDEWSHYVTVAVPFSICREDYANS